MSLFICMSCGCIENTNLISKNIYTLKGKPNMVRMEMDGFSNGSKERGEINYICSKCNTGIWHGQFEKVQANDAEKAVAKFSECNMITPLDHTIELVKDDSMRFGYRLPTEEEITERTNSERRKRKNKINVLATLSALDNSGMLSKSFENLFGEDNETEEQSEYIRNLFLMRAEYKRKYKELKKKENKTKEDLERLEILNIKRRECNHSINGIYDAKAILKNPVTDIKEC